MTEPTPKPVPFLLSGDEKYRTTLPPESIDFQVRVGYPETPDRPTPSPCVLVLTRTEDREIDELSVWLASINIPMLRLDSDRSPALPLVWDPIEGTVALGETAFRPVVCWGRYFTVGSVPAVGPDPAGDAYMRDQWHAAAESLAELVGAHVINPHAGTQDRLAQLAQARSAGLRTPATIVTNDLAAAPASIPGDGDLIVKSIGAHFVEPEPGELAGLIPRRVTRKELAGESDLEPAPAIVQEYVPSDRELRVYAIGGELFSFGVRKPTLGSLWSDSESVEVEEISLPPALDARLKELSERWHLDVAAFDFLDTPDGEVFLEVNTACSWVWSERAAGKRPVTDALRALISRLFEERTGFAPPEGP